MLERAIGPSHALRRIPLVVILYLKKIKSVLSSMVTPAGTFETAGGGGIQGGGGATDGNSGS
jgi:hypothetical protein